MCPVVEIDTETIDFPPDARLIDSILERIREARSRRAPVGGAAEG
jgi:hypothetical protein